MSSVAYGTHSASYGYRVNSLLIGTPTSRTSRTKCQVIYLETSPNEACSTPSAWICVPLGSRLGRGVFHPRPTADQLRAWEFPFETTTDLTPPVEWTEYPSGGTYAEIPLDGTDAHRYFRL
jgi:hypothetical protein